jgi:hypothetical protein
VSGRARHRIPDLPRTRPNARDVAAMITAFYRRLGNYAGGVLHVQLDDGNIGVGFWLSGLSDAVAVGDAEAADICRAMLAMTPTQRRRACAMADRLGWRNVNGQEVGDDRS